MRPAPSIATTASSAAWRTARIRARPVAAPRSSGAASATAMAAPVRALIDVQHDLDGGLGGRVVEARPGDRRLECRPEDRPPEGARPRGRLGAHPPAARDQPLGDGALAL